MNVYHIRVYTVDSQAEEEVVNRSLEGNVALVAGATRGAGRGIAIELGAAGATVYVTDAPPATPRPNARGPRPSRKPRPSCRRPAGRGIPIRVDHFVPTEVRALVDRIRAEQGHLEILVNDIWGAEKLMEWNKPVWEHDLEKGLRMQAWPSTDI